MKNLITIYYWLSLRVSPESQFDWKFLKIGSVIIYSFIKNKDRWQFPAPATKLVINIKGVYVINYSWYGQIIDPLNKSLMNFCSGLLTDSAGLFIELFIN